MKFILVLLFYSLVVLSFSVSSLKGQQTDIPFDFRDTLSKPFVNIPDESFPSGYFVGQLTASESYTEILTGYGEKYTFSFYEWLALYNDLYFAGINHQLDSNYMQLWRNIRFNSAIDTVVHIGLLDFSYQDFSQNALSSGRIFLKDGIYHENHSVNVPAWRTDSIAVAGLLVDSLPMGKHQLKLDEQFLFNNRGISVSYVEIDLLDGSPVLTVDSFESIEVEFLSAGQQELKMEFVYDNGLVISCKAKVNIFNPHELRSSVNTPDFEVKVTFNASYHCGGTLTHLNADKVTFDVGVWYHKDCNAEGSPFIRKPFIIVTGFGPFDSKGVGGSFYTDGNLSGLFDALRADGYDIIVLDNRYGGDCVQHNAEMIEKTLNMLNGYDQSVPELVSQSNFEPVIMGQSLGGVAVRYALANMEKKHYQNPVNPHHRCRLFISHEGEMEGAVIMLGFQQFVTNALVILPVVLTSSVASDAAVLTGIISASGAMLTNNELLNSHTAKQLLIYHRSQVGISQTAAQDPLRTTLLKEFKLNLNHPGTVVPGYPVDCRSIAISNGNSDGGPIDYTPGEQMLKWRFLTPTPIRLPVGIDINAIKKQSNFRTFSYTFAGIPVISRKVDFAEEIETIPGSSFGFHSKLCDGLTSRLGTALNWIPGFRFEGNCTEDMFVPTISTFHLHKPNGTLQDWYFDFKNSDLPFVRPVEKGKSMLGQLGLYGYPHINHSTNHNTLTPFDALYASEDYERHVEDKTTDLQVFIIDEIEPREISFDQNNRSDTLYIQNRHFNQNYYAELEHRKTIKLGRDVTFKSSKGDVNIENGAWLSLHAQERIVLTSGFHAKYGSSVHIQNIDTYRCPEEEIFEEDPRQRIMITSNVDNIPDKNLSKVKFTNSENKNNKLFLKIVPNPNNGEFDIWLNCKGNAMMTIYDQLGIPVLKKMQYCTTKKIHVNCSLSSGIYFLTLSNNENHETIRFIAQ